jgi:Zn-dependent peptidase ImmA (M78 family)/transcriptional regulator with XRE-family HTH domain
MLRKGGFLGQLIVIDLELIKIYYSTKSRRTILTMNNENRVVLTKPQILTWARDELRIDVPTVAKRFNKLPATIESWESGDESPTFNQLKELANYYKRPLAVFFLPKVPPKSPLPHDYRTLSESKQGEYSKKTLLAYRAMRNMLSEAHELFDILNLNVTFDLPHWAITDSPETMADRLRQSLGISIKQQIELFGNHTDAQNGWRDALFDHGVIVRICEMPIVDARAFCLFGNELGGIGLSNEDREHGRIFSLFHEVCHLSINMPGVSGVLSRNKSKNEVIEQYCDRFAASFLLPATEISVLDSMKLFDGSSIDFLELSRFIADKFKVSKYVVIRRAFDLGYIHDDVYWQLIGDWKAIDKEYAKTHKASFGNYNVNQVSYMGRRFVGLVMRAFQSNQITSLDAKRILGISPSTIESM